MDWSPSLRSQKELGITSRTLTRWMADPRMGFPEPVVLNQRNFFVRAAIEDWKLARIRVSVRMTEPECLRAA
jgi:hypothetical protein